MARRVVVPANVKPSTSPLSAAVASGNFVFVSGQTAAHLSGAEAQTRGVLENLGTILRAAGSDYAHVLRCGVYLKNVSDLAAMNAVYREFFPSEQPARATIICALVNSAILVEIDCVAEAL